MIHKRVIDYWYQGAEKERRRRESIRYILEGFIFAALLVVSFALGYLVAAWMGRPF